MSARPHRPTTILIALILLAGCSSKPRSYPLLADLQAEMEQQRGSDLPALAPTAFAEAELALTRAERSLGEVGIEELRHLTAMAALRLATAQAEGHAAAARAERDRLLEERRSILGQARGRQLPPGTAELPAPRTDDTPS